MNIQVTADVVMVFGIISLLAERGYRIIIDMRNGRNGNGSGKYVTYQDFMKHTSSCAGSLHKKVDEQHTDTIERLTKLESML